MNNNLPSQAVFLCGGLGSRLKPLTDQLPKPMVDVNGKPFLWYLLDQLSDKGIKQFLLLTGYLGQTVQAYFSDGSRWGWQIRYSHGPAEWDTGRRIWEAKDQLDEEFILAYSDNFVQIRLDLLEKTCRQTKAAIGVHLAPKMNGNIRLELDERISIYDPTRASAGLEHVEVGYMLANKGNVLEVLETVDGFPDVSFSKVLQRLAKEKMLAGIVIHDPYHSIGDLERLEKTRHYLQPKKIVLIDRDGTINRKAPPGRYIRNWSEFELIPETRAGLSELARKGYYFIVITNQAGVARGIVDPVDLELIHENMVRELAVDGIKILKVYVCMEHWETNSHRRKPNPGMFYEASAEFGLRLDKSVYIGDDSRDCKAAFNAGTRCVFLGSIAELSELQENQWPLLVSEKFPSVPSIERLITTV